MLCRNNWFVKKSFQLLIFQVKDCYRIGQSVFCIEHNSISDRKNVQRKLEISKFLINIYKQQKTRSLRKGLIYLMKNILKLEI